ncbi:hypothetical protein ACFL1H_04460 [Nanoarchaeota archaeon]
MEQKVKKDILAVLTRTIDIISVKEEKDIMELKEISNHTVHNASIFQDEDSVSIAILTYAMAKIMERSYEMIDHGIYAELVKAKGFLKEDYLEGYRDSIKKTFDLIRKIDKKLGRYIQEVIDQAEVKKGSKLYEHGISMARASSILGVTQWELMNYLGKTTYTNITSKKITALDRLKYSRRLFQL